MFHVPDPKGVDLAREGRSEVSSPLLFAEYPSLVEFVELEVVEGLHRQGGTILVFSQEGRIKLMLKDLDSWMVCFVTSDSLQGALEAAERVLGGSGGDWRRDKSKPRQPKGG